MVTSLSWMVENSSQHWTFRQDTTTFLYMMHPSPRPPFGKYEYIKVPFGLAKAPAYFQELMTGILKDFNFTIGYLDDIIIFSRTAEEYLDHIKQVLEMLRSTHLSMKLSKCHFFTMDIQYLGHILSTKGIRPLPSKCQAIKNMPPPKTPKQVCAFLGLMGYYGKPIRNFAKGVWCS